MRILYLAHRIPYPPDKGDKIRAYHQLARLAERHHLELITLVDDPEDIAHVPALERFCARVDAFRLTPIPARLRALAAVATGRPFSPAYFREPGAAAAVGRRLDAGGIDAVLLYCSAMGGLLPDRFGRLDVPLIADYVDLDSAKWAAAARHGRWPASLLHRREARTLAAYETALAARCARVVFTTPREVDDFLELLRGDGPGGYRPGRAANEGEGLATAVEAIPNGVDVEFFADGEPGVDRMAEPPPTLVFTGAMDYVANHQGVEWFLDEVWPRIRARRRDARFCVVGRRPPRRLRRRSGRNGVEVTGYVPDVRPYLRKAWVAVAPLQIARGVQNKVLEAMAAGTPTVVTSAAARGLQVTDGRETLIVESPGEWAEMILRLLDEPELRRSLAVHAHAYVDAHHTWKAHGERWQRILEDVVGTRRVAA